MFDKLPAQKKKNYLNHEKIASFRKNFKTTENGGRQSLSGTSLHAFEHKNGITFSCRYMGTDWSGAEGFSDQFKYKLQLRTTKLGEQRFIFYNLLNRQVGVRTASPNYMRSKLRTLCDGQERARKKPRVEEFPRGLYKAQEKRMLAFLKGFLRRHGISFQGLSNDPFSLMVQLCYPGTRSFDEETLQEISTGEFVLEDPLRLILRTKGKKSRRLLYSAIKKHPAGTQTVLKMARYLRINRSLDEAQKFLEKITSLSTKTDAGKRFINDSESFEYRVRNLSAKQMKVFDPLDTEAAVNAICGADSERIVSDTFRMIDQLNAGEGFDLTRIRYRNIIDLHDALAALRPRNSNNFKRFEHYEFGEGHPSMKFCSVLKENFKDDEYEICYPTGTDELQTYAQIMHNCAFYYHEEIQRKGYAIFCLKRQRMEYMFGVRLQKSKNQAVIAILDQAVGPCNRRIDVDLKRRLNLCVEQAVKPEFTYWHDNQLSLQ